MTTMSGKLLLMMIIVIAMMILMMMMIPLLMMMLMVIRINKIIISIDVINIVTWMFFSCVLWNMEEKKSGHNEENNE